MIKEEMTKEGKEGIKIPLKSIIMLIGPSGCGKSFLIKDQIVPQLKCLVPDANIQILSSDGYRREILGKDLDKTDSNMKYASEGAFRLMEAKFDAVTTWPITADFVILDATFIGREIREQFVEKARKAQYQLVGLLFDFDDREEYFKYILDIGHRRLISQHLKRFQKELGEIGRKDFDYFYKIKGKDRGVKLEKDNSYDYVKLAKLPYFNSYFIVGDLHGCLNEFKELLIAGGFEIDNEDKIRGKDDSLIILIGDIPDKGNQVAELIDFIYKNLDRIKICIGGHDRSLTRYIELKETKEKETTKENINEEVDIIENIRDKNKSNYFDSAGKLDKDSLAKFKIIMEGQWYFYIHDHFVVTHSICDNKYIGKFDKVSIKKQKSDLYPFREDYSSEKDYIDDLKKYFSYTLNEAKKFDPYHIFGHIAVNNSTIIGNKIFLDTGCVYGNKLTGVLVDVEYDRIRLKFRSVGNGIDHGIDRIDQNINSIINLDDIEIKNDNDITFESIEEDDKIDIIEFAKNKVNFISGTMSPSDSNKKKRTLEDMMEAFSYYREKGIEKVILQKKYMGSRANMYLFPKDIDKSYMVSRNGFIIRRLDLKLLYEKMLKFLVDKKIKNGGGILDGILDSELIIIDGELMPWSALGKSLIDSHFMVVGKGVESELKLLEDTCFENALEDLRNRYEDSKFKELKRQYKKDDLKRIIGENQYRQMSSFGNFKWMTIKEQKNPINIYNKQIEIYGKEYKGLELEFKPFAVLKIVYKDGDNGERYEDNVDNDNEEKREYKEELFWDYSNEIVFNMVSDDTYLITTTDNIGLESGKEWFDKISKEGYEGVVVKPLEKVYIPGIAPYIKVRNPNYLTIIYGYDYLIEPKLTQMIENKNIKKKLKSSIKEFDIGKRMLEIPYRQIDENNIEYLNLCAQMVIEEKNEKELDPRL